MIAKLNLMPWRDARKKQHQQRFFGMLSAAILVALGCVWLVSGWYSQQHEIQHARNGQLDQELTRLEDELSMLPELDAQRDALVERLAVIADIQKGRNQVTRLLSLMPGVVPQGVYLDELSTDNNWVQINGMGESNGRLATLLGNGEQSEWIRDIAMHSIVAAKEEPKERTVFRASFTLLPPELHNLLDQGQTNE